MLSYKLLISLIVLFVAFGSCQQLYTRKFMLALDPANYEDHSRGDLIQQYFASWSAASGVDFTQFSQSESIRQKTVSNLDRCNPLFSVEQQDYLWGSFENELVMQLKSKIPLIIPIDYAYQPFIPADDYQSGYHISTEFEVHPCQAFMKTFSSILVPEGLVDFQNCSEVEHYFPDAFSKTDKFVNNDRERSFEYIQTRSGTYLDKQVDLEFTLKYSTYLNAVEDESARSGWFSFIMYNDQLEFSVEQTEMGIKVYEQIRDELAYRAEYPCDDDDTNVSDFFHTSYLAYTSDSSNLTYGSLLLVLIVFLLC